MLTALPLLIIFAVASGRQVYQGSKAPAFSVPRESFAPLSPAENPTAFWRVGEQQHVRETRPASSPSQGSSWVPQTAFVRKTYPDASGGGDATSRARYSRVAYGHYAAAPPNDCALRGGPTPTRLDSGGYTPPGEDSLRFDGGDLNAWPCGEDGGLVAATGGGEEEREEEEDGEVHGREVGYKVAGLYVARAAASPNVLPLPPLYHLVRVVCVYAVAGVRVATHCVGILSGQGWFRLVCLPSVCFVYARTSERILETGSRCCQRFTWSSRRQHEKTKKSQTVENFAVSPFLALVAKKAKKYGFDGIFASLNVWEAHPLAEDATRPFPHRTSEHPPSAP